VSDDTVKVAQERVDRLDRIEHAVRVIGTLAALVLLVVLLAQNVILERQLHDVSNQQDRNACANVLIADGFAAAGRALAAPPAPNSARDLAVAGIIRASDRLARSATVCADGKP
jgi:hypothetical protein